MARFRKIAIVEANRWWKHGDDPDVYKDDQVEYLANIGSLEDRKCSQCKNKLSKHGWIDTLEGSHCVCPGDWIIVGIKGEKYPCKPDIFEKSYEKVGESNE